MRRTSLLLAAAGFALCCSAAWAAGRAALGRVLAETAPGLYGTAYEGDAARLAGRAVALSPSDPEARRARAVVLAAAGDDGGAVLELERAASLRPRHYLAWLRLGRGRERAGDAGGAIEAYREAVRLAPAYAAPRWQLGNTLLRAGRLEEAFTELRAAAASRPALFGYTIELAWRAYGEDARAVVAALRPKTPRQRAGVARFFARRGRAAEAVEQFRAGGGEAGGEERRALVAELTAARRFREAYEVWSGKAAAVGVLLDGGFEEKAAGGEGFGWQFARGLEGVGASLDVSGPREGARSLLLDFAGTPDPAARLASQLVLVEPGARYRLSFAARTEKLVSGGPPAVFVFDEGAAGGDSRVLARSEPLPRDTEGWKSYEIEFDAATEGAGAVRVVVRRLPCAAAPCPVFGRLWLDEFSLRRVG